MSSNIRSKRFAIWYHNNFGRNDGAPLYYWNLMKNKLGIDVDHLMPEGDTRRFGQFDYHLWVDYGEDGLPTDKSWRIPDDGGKKIYVCSDCHIDEAGRDYRFDRANQFDYVFFNQLRALEEWSKLKESGSEKGIVANWLPHAAEPDVYKNFEILKKYDIGFIGHMQDTKNYNDITRLEFLEAMFEAFPNFYFGTRHQSYPERNLFEDASKRFGESRIVLNISITDDVNMRVFEALSSGSFLLTNELPTMKFFGEEGKHWATYSTIREAIEKTKYYLAHEDEREEIAKAGHELFLKEHTYEHRFRTICETIGEKLDGSNDKESGGSGEILGGSEGNTTHKI